MVPSFHTKEEHSSELRQERGKGKGGEGRGRGREERRGEGRVGEGREGEERPIWLHSVIDHVEFFIL